MSPLQIETGAKAPQTTPRKLALPCRSVWASLARVGSNFLGNSWVKSGCRSFEQRPNRRPDDVSLRESGTAGRSWPYRTPLANLTGVPPARERARALPSASITRLQFRWSRISVSDSGRAARSSKRLAAVTSSSPVAGGRHSALGDGRQSLRALRRLGRPGGTAGSP